MLHDLDIRVRKQEVVLGTWLYLNDVGTAEIVAGAGFDFVIIDMEHSPTGISALRSLIMAVEHRCAPIVRVKANSPECISAALDMGPAGVMVPRVNTAEQAAVAVQNAKYYPLGLRGFGPYRVSDYTRNMPQVLSEANKKQMLWVQIEHKDAVKNIESIVKTPGVDAYFIGPGDLSQSLGHLGDTGHPEVVAAMEKALACIKNAGISAGSAFGSVGQAADWVKKGMSIITVGADFRFVLNGAAETFKSMQCLAP